MKNFYGRRRLLVLAGWKRRDRHNDELWQPPIDDVRQNLVTFRTAWNRYMYNGATLDKLTIEIRRMEKELGK